LSSFFAHKEHGEQNHKRKADHKAEPGVAWHGGPSHKRTHKRKRPERCTPRILGVDETPFYSMIPAVVREYQCKGGRKVPYPRGEAAKDHA
jgi:hypothetical protein